MRSYTLEGTSLIFFFLISLIFTVACLAIFTPEPIFMALGLGSLVCLISFLSIFALAQAVCKKGLILKLVAFALFLVLKATLILLVVKGLVGRPDAFLAQAVAPLSSLLMFAITVFIFKKKNTRSLELIK